MFTTKLIQKKEPTDNTQLRMVFGYENWHIVFPEDGTLVPKHEGEIF